MVAAFFFPVFFGCLVLFVVVALRGLGGGFWGLWDGEKVNVVRDVEAEETEVTGG